MNQMSNVEDRPRSPLVTPLASLDSSVKRRYNAKDLQADKELFGMVKLVIYFRSNVIYFRSNGSTDKQSLEKCVNA